MATCIRCNTELGLFEKVALLAKVKICFACDKQIDETLNMLQQQMMHLSSQNTLDEQFRGYVHQTLASNRVPQERAGGLLNQLNYLKYICDIRKGNLPTVHVSTILDTDERAHLAVMATYYKPNKQVKLIQGQLIATNKKLYFITPARDSMKIDWNNVVQVSQASGTTAAGQPTTLMHIQVTKGSGGGLYHVPDPTLAVAIIETAVRIWKRHLVELKANPNIAGVPEHVKVAVFQRDGGRCRQCGYVGPYIEYDHILPRSKGGPNTVQNIQLLCRQCNLKKGSRI